MSLPGGSLRAALGVCPQHLLPHYRSGQWTECARLLSLTGAGRIRTPTHLWRLLHRGRFLPHGTTWGALCGDTSLESLLEAVTRSSSIGGAFASWNVRWMVNPHTAVAAGKRRVIEKALSKRQVVLLQETHWFDKAIGIWEAGTFMHSKVVAAAARPGHEGGPQGGVAIVCPGPHTVIEHATLIPGCAVRARVRNGAAGNNDGDITYISLYLPPDDRDEIMAALANLPVPEPPIMLGADINIDLWDPRDATEARLAADFLALCARWGIEPLEPQSPTHLNSAERGGGSKIDITAVSTCLGPSWGCKGQWHNNVSDHAMLTAMPANAYGRPSPCTPGALKTLPAAAWPDLRRAFRGIEIILGVPDSPAAPDWRPSYTRAEQETLPEHHPARETIDDGTRPNEAPVPGESPIPFCPAVAVHGRAYVDSVLNAWWNRWRRKNAAGESIAAELRRACNATTPHPPNPALAQWLRSMGWDGANLSASQAAAWYAAHISEERGRRRARLPSRVLGAGTARPRPSQTDASAKRLLKGRAAVKGVSDDSGQLHTDPIRMEQLLWDSRSHIWGTVPTPTDAASPLLEAYFRTPGPLAAPPEAACPGGTLPQPSGRGPPPHPPPRPRRLEFGAPCPTWEVLQGLVLAPSNSMPGLDGHPYELYHVAPRFLACLVGQAALVAPHGAWAVRQVIGGDVELLVWIPKGPDGGTTTGSLRPLQLPDCKKRILGAYWAHIVGPQIEPQLSATQAAKKGGNCGVNIRQAFLHLDPRGPQPPAAGDIDDELWRAVLGPAADPVQAICLEAGRGGIADIPACTFADQEKAFEHISLEWIEQVLRGWQAPEWVISVAIALTAQRCVQGTVGGRPGPTHRTHRSIGMGGPASMLLWNIGYDPIVEAVGGPTFVDDLAALTTGPTATLRAQFFLLAAGLAAGLRVAAHTCEALIVRNIAPGVARACRALPAQWTRDGSWTTIRGIPAHIIDKVARHCVGPGWGQDIQVLHGPCNCTVKTVVVPQQRHQEWRQAMAHGPFGHSCVACGARYLGAWVESPSATALAPHLKWARSSFTRLAKGTWRKATTSIEDRARLLSATPSSPAVRAKQWNLFCVSCVPYPAQIVPAHPHDALRLKACLQEINRTAGWAPWWLPTAIGIHWKIAGAPRCPIAVLDSAAAIATLSNQPWGSTEVEEMQLGSLAVLADFASRRAGSGDPRSEAADASQVAACVRQHQHRGAALVRGKGGALYRTAWRARHDLELQEWLRNVTRSRRWLSDTGAEWDLLRVVTRYNTAYHVLRTLAGGIHSPAKNRPAATRTAFPHSCIGCGQARIALSWRTPHPDKEGLEWCHGCSPFPDGAPARTVLGRLRQHDARGPRDPDDEAAGPGTRPQDALADFLHQPGARWHDTDASPFGACPLCGAGEVGAEHVLRWCPAVAHAWHLLQPGGGPFDDAVRGGHGCPQDTASLIHQAAYLCGALSHKSPLPWRKGARMLAAAVRTYTRGPNHGDDDDEDEESRAPPEQHAGSRRICPTWASLASAECNECSRHAVHHVKCGHTHSSATPHPAHIGRWRPFCGRRVAIGDPITAQFAEEAAASWPAEGPHWFPPPRPVAPQLASTIWHLTRCWDCGHHRRILRAAVDLGPDDEITIALGQSGNTGWAAEQTGMIVTFDGGARPVQGRNVAAGAAVLWGHDTQGEWRPSVTRSTAIPYHVDSQIAEAWGARMALDFLCEAPEGPREVRICGDNLGVIRYCAGTGRASRPEIHDILDPPLRRAASQGWRIDWEAVRRRHNTGSDRAATAGCALAARRANDGHNSICHTLTYGDAATYDALRPPPETAC